MMKIWNDQFEVAFTTTGGEITSFKNKQDGSEYMWKGDEKYWKGKNPTLFPIVGNTYDGTYEIEGKTYTFKNHGFIRISELECTTQSDTSITFTLHDNEATRKVYPFAFTYQIHYTLEANTLHIDYTIHNDSEVAMPFGFGLHPGFNCPIGPDEKFEDYHLTFEHEEHLQQLIREEGKKPYYEAVDLYDIPMDYASFEKHQTLIYKGMTSSYVTYKSNQHAIRIRIAGFPLLAVWTPQRGAPFVCIEPWYSHGDFEAVDVAFEKREGMMVLAPEETFNTGYTIEIL